uniref:Transposase n=1 Tax=Globodera rostochiensis TaxID=31243 RepID=A0A914H824_GLORO
MEIFWFLILAAFFATNSLDKAESVKVKLELKTFDEIFGEGWWDKGEAEDLKTPAPTNFGQNVHHQIDRQNTQLGQIEPNLTDQLGQIEPNLTDQLGQIEPNLTDQLGQNEPNSTDQNPPPTESDHSDNAKNGAEQNEIIKEISSNQNIAEDERKRKIVDKFHAIKDEFKQKGQYSTKERSKIEEKIANHLKVSRKKIYKWKKEFGLSRKVFYEKEERKHLVEKFDRMKAELMRAGFKNSYYHEIDETVAKKLGISDTTIYKWKRKFGQTKPKKFSHSEQKELMKRYYQIKDQKTKISDKDIVKSLQIGTNTLYKWKRQFKRQELHPNSVDGHSVEENAAANVQEIGNSNSGNI